MKNYFKILLIACIGAMVVSCGDEELDIVVSVDNLLGEWELVTMTADMNTATSAGAVGVDITADMSIATTTTDYTLTFSESSWSTSGSYSYEYDVTVDQTQQSDELMLSDVTGSGDFQLDGSMITLSGAFFNYEIDGFDASAMAGEQAATLSFNGDGNLVFTQSIDQEIEQSGFTVTTDGGSVSVWRKL